MKRLGFNSIIAAAIILLFSSCSKEGRTFVAHMEDVGRSSAKSYIQNRHNCWESGDKVYVNGQQYSVTLSNGAATFEVDRDMEGPYRLFTFGSQSVSSSDNGATYSFSIPSNYSGQDMPMYCSADEPGEITFRNICAVIHFTGLSSGDQCQVTANTNNISGTFTYNPSTGTLSGGSSKTRTVTATGSEVWMVVPVFSTSQTLSFKIGNTTKRTTGYFVSNSMVTVNKASFNNATNNTTTCHTAEELYDALTSNAPVISLEEDVDMSDYNEISYSLARWGNGVEINGHGHTITITKPLYSRLSFIFSTTIVVKDLTLAGTFTSRYSYALVESAGGANFQCTNCFSQVTYNGNRVAFAPSYNGY